MNKKLIILSSFLIVALFLLGSCTIEKKPIGVYAGYAICSGSGTGTSSYSEKWARDEARDAAFDDADGDCKSGTACDGSMSTSCSRRTVFGIPDDIIEYTCTATLRGKCSLTTTS